MPVGADLGGAGLIASGDPKEKICRSGSLARRQRRERPNRRRVASSPVWVRFLSGPKKC
jgi:hypothetical protein